MTPCIAALLASLACQVETLSDGRRTTCPTNSYTMWPYSQPVASVVLCIISLRTLFTIVEVKQNVKKKENNFKKAALSCYAVTQQCIKFLLCNTSKQKSASSRWGEERKKTKSLNCPRMTMLRLSIGSRALSFSGPLLSVDVEFCWFASASFSGPLLSHSVEFCGFVCGFVRNFEVKYLGNQRS